MADALYDGRPFRGLTVIDEGKREALPGDSLRPSFGGLVVRAYALIRGFASSPRGEFALIGKGFSVLEEPYARTAPLLRATFVAHTNPSSCSHLARRRQRS